MTYEIKHDEKIEKRGNFFNSLVKIDLALFAIVVLLLTLKLTRTFFPGIGLSLIVTFGLMAVFSIFFAFSDKLIFDIKNVLLQIAINITCSILTLGVLFSLFFWPGAGVLTNIGFFSALGCLAWLTGLTGKHVYGFANFQNKALLTKLLFFFMLGAWFELTSPLEVYKQVNSHGNDPVSVRLYEQHLADPEDETKRNAVWEYNRSKKVFYFNDKKLL
jgi:hypothetical protein